MNQPKIIRVIKDFEKFSAAREEFEITSSGIQSKLGSFWYSTATN